MVLTRRQLTTEIHEGAQSSGIFYLGDNRVILDELLRDHKGRIKLIYMDPPYTTGDKFHMRVRVGAADWKAGRSSLILNTFSDRTELSDYLAGMREVLKRCHELLSSDGMLFLHVDYRIQPHLRLMLDEIFGEDNFLNEIIWAYQTGGRSTRHFSRKHDVILFYAKGPNYDFNVQEVMVKPEAPRSNHMRRHVDPDGRVYRSIRVGGKVYTYYDDDPVAPSDVWTDLSHLQQRDPERTGYDTQKPLSLLDRIVRCASRSGDTVMDPFCGSGTALEAAARTGRSFIGIDQCTCVPNILRRRLYKSGYTLQFPNAETADDPECNAQVLAGVGFYHITLTHFQTSSDNACHAVPEGFDGIDSWSVGYLREDGYHVQDEFIRNRKSAELTDTLDLPAYAGRMAMCINDVYGNSFLYEIDP